MLVYTMQIIAGDHLFFAMGGVNRSVWVIPLIYTHNCVHLEAEDLLRNTEVATDYVTEENKSTWQYQPVVDSDF